MREFRLATHARAEHKQAQQSEQRDVIRAADAVGPTVEPQRGSTARVPLAGLALRATSAVGNDPLGGTTAPQDVVDVLRRRRGRGQPLPDGLADQFGEQYGADLSGVRIHADGEADQIARSVQAVAFTHSNDVYFSQGSYSANTGAGQRLLAHELAHVAQQNSGSGTGSPGLTIGRADDPAEAAADRMAADALRGLRRTTARSAEPVAGSMPATINRWPWSKKKPKEPQISAPAGGHVMTDQEKGGVPDAKALTAMKGEQDSQQEFERLGHLPVTAGDEEKAQARQQAKQWAPEVSDDPALPKSLLETTIYELRADGQVGDSTTTTADLTGRVLVPWARNPNFLVVKQGVKRFLVHKDLVAKKPEYVKEVGGVFPVGSDGKVVEPRADDVVQGSLGDCYLEAALSSMAKTAPKAIMDMIKDFGDTAAIRLYDVDRTDPAKPKFTARYVRVAKSRARHNGELVLDKGALWVGMIEKAYAAGKFGGSEASTAAHRSEATASFDKIASGYSNYAFEVLLGRPAQRVAIVQSIGRNDHDHQALPWSTSERTEYKNTASKPGGSYSGLSSFAALGGDKAKVITWMTWLNGNGLQKIYDLYISHRGQKDVDAYKMGAMRVEDFERMFKNTGLADDVAKPMLTYLEGFFPGKRGTGKYTPTQLDVWDKIVDALAKKKMVAASSHTQIARANTGVGHSGGESVAKGMVGGHAFTVLDWYEADALKFVQMRNPWGNYSRTYDFTATKATGGQAKEVKDGDGISWFELDDVTKRFHSIDIL